MFFLPVFERHCLPNTQDFLRSYVEYKRKRYDLNFRAMQRPYDARKSSEITHRQCWRAHRQPTDRFGPANGVLENFELDANA